jgi:putative acetyltransferase
VTETRHSALLGAVARSHGSPTRHRPPQNLVVRSAVPTDLPAILATARAAFGYELEAKLIARLERERRVAVAVVALSGERIVGHALLSRVGLIARDVAPLPALALAPVAVAPAQQGRGIGCALVRACLGLADPALPVFVIGDPAYYTRFGFEAAGTRRWACRFELPPGHFMVRLADRSPADVAARTVDYPAAFGGL